MIMRLGDNEMSILQCVDNADCCHIKNEHEYWTAMVLSLHASVGARLADYGYCPDDLA